MARARILRPEVGNVMTRWGVEGDPEGAFETLKVWMESQPSGIEGRRQMPQYNLTDEEIRGLAEFFRLGRSDRHTGLAAQ